MNQQRHSKLSFCAAIITASIACVVSANAAFINVPTLEPQFGSSASPLTSTAGGAFPLLGGTILDSAANSFSQSIGLNTFAGTIRSIVVDNLNGGLDFYYQVTNSSSGPSPDLDMWRLFIAGYPDALVVDATFSTANPSGFLGGALNFAEVAPTAGNGVFSADRDNSFQNENAGFDFDAAQDLNSSPFGPAPDNIFAGETSNWLVLRTNTTSYANSFASTISGLGINGAGAFAPIPEPSTIGFGLALAGICAGSRRRRAAAVKQS